MTDTLTPQERSERMSRIRGKDSASEIRLRRLIHGMGYRYRLHVKTLPGTPDLVFPARKAVIFMHGCFWHRHQGCKGATIPKTNKKFWADKFARNVANDHQHLSRLRRRGWHVAVIWECQLRHSARVLSRLQRFLTPL